MRTGRTRAGFTSGYGISLPPISADTWTLADTRRLFGVIALGLILAAVIIGGMAVAS